MKLSWLRLALLEWTRRPVRLGVTVTAVALAIASLLSVLAFERGYRQGLRSELDRLGAQILVVPKGCPYDAASLALHGANWPCHLRATYHSEIAGIRGVAVAVPLLMQAVAAGTGSNVVYLGSDPSILRLRTAWRIDGRFPEREGEVLVGANLARRFGWRVGQTLPLPGLVGVRGTVAGILQPTGHSDDYFIHLPLADAQRVFRRPGQLTHILVRLSDPTRLDEVVGSLRGCDAGMNLNVVPVAHLFGTLQDLVRSTRWLLGCVVAVALLVAGAGVTNSLLMAITERTRELGIFRALGASSADVFRLVQLEALTIGIAGGLLGVLAAFASAGLLESWLRTHLPLAPTGSLVAWDGELVVGSLAGSVVLACLAACLPAWRACTLDPRAAIQNGNAL